ncbi:hypothetical protein FOA43_001081 [Brettanomyces nanus]|uniref:GYF domain-containing protein n=1 Tax=Eeniella nana TaxID=13502 RepID=A0A875RTR1_EENNA|nr:uncharacterized protein FOA43_001081 [Brettanomyces nanus]QPG73767.1 hypothetical protein FOA43_001081 [Brettanomyces nanus]
MGDELLEDLGGVKRRKIMEGYDSDSTGDEEGVGEEAGKAEEEVEEAEEKVEEDLEEEVEEAENEKEIEEFEDEKPVGLNSYLSDSKMESFSMEEDDEEETELWLKKIKKSDIIKAREAESARKTHQEEQERKKRKQKETTKTWELMEELIKFLEPAETSEELLQRKYHQLKRSKDKAKRDILQGEIRRLTDVIEQISDRDYPAVYEISREQFLREYRKEAGKEWQLATGGATGRLANHSAVEWEYRWNLDDEITYGPFDSATMHGWKEDYFQNNVAYARKVGATQFQDAREIDYYADISNDR